MCKWCENYRFTVNATSKMNLADHGDYYVHANYCPVCGKLLNENTKEKNKPNKFYIIRVKPNVRHNLPSDGQNYYCSTFGLHYDECSFGKKEEAYPFKTRFEAKCTADWFFNENNYEIEEIEDLTPPTKKGKRELKEDKEKIPHFTEEDFYLKSESGSVIKAVYDKDTNKKYMFSPKTIDKINQIVDKLNKALN